MKMINQRLVRIKIKTKKERKINEKTFINFNKILLKIF